MIQTLVKVFCEEYYIPKKDIKSIVRNCLKTDRDSSILTNDIMSVLASKEIDYSISKKE